MAWSISAGIEAALCAAAERHLPRAALAQGALVQAVIARSRRYTSERDELHESLPRAAEDADLAARALFFTVADAAKAMVPMAELHGRGLLPDHGELRILDVGAGMGAMTLGVLDHLRRAGALGPDRTIAIRACDRDARALAVLGSAVHELGRMWQVPVSMAMEHAELARGPLDLVDPRSEARPHLVLAGSVLNELPGPMRVSLVQAMLDAVDPRGAVIIIEPALRHTARDLHELRDVIVQNRLAHVFAPCTRVFAPCPALASEADWCHEDRPTSLPPGAARLAAATGLRTHGLKFAYLTLRKASAPQISPGESPAEEPLVALRLVSQPKKSKGKRECFVCSDAGRHRLRLLHRNASEANAALEHARRGDVIVAPSRLAPGGDVTTGDPITVAQVLPPVLTG